MDGPDASTATVPTRALASFRLPPFSAEEPELWLTQVECAFEVAGVTSTDVQFKLLVANLPMSVASQVKDIINASPGSYADLCAALRQRLAHSRAGRLEALLRHQQLGDQRPSQLLRRMKSELSAAGDVPADSGLLRTLFLQRLPHVVRAALALLPENHPLDDLALAADRFVEASEPSLDLVASTSATPSSMAPLSGVTAPPAVGARDAPVPGMVDLMQGMVAAITSAVGRLETALGERSRTPSRQASPRRRSDRDCNCGRSRNSSPRRQSAAGRSSTPSRQGEPVCWYHRTFGEDAHQCRPPCSWTGNDSA